MAGLGGGRAAGESEVSAEELKVARILVMLPRLVWEADHGPPCTHNLRWGAKKRRSACADDDDGTPEPLPPVPAPPPPPAPENLSKKRCREATAAAVAQVPLRKDARHEARQGQAVAGKHPEEAGAVAAASAMGTSSPETPLEFYPSAEEADATAGARACPPDAGRPPAKKPRLKREHLSKQVDQLSRTRTELQKEAVEIRKRLEALRARNSELVELRIKLEERKQQRPRDCVDLLPAGPVRPASAAQAPDPVHPQAQPPPQQQQQQYQQSWPQHWVNNNHVMFHQVAAPGFSIHPPPAAAAPGSQGWSWAGAQARRADGDGGGSRPGKVMDLNSSAGLDLALESQQQLHHPQKQQQQQSNYYYQQQQEQKAARKKRIQMMQQRRNAAGAGGASVKVASFIR
ncbi:hypothetical protein Taro_036771 [Colocasia esculenta]|uniref:Uncharacterized protein n=1 Tax=Colocasia esculenta TaxID=4460 RepID=A0A843W9A8_COLES|nr:hypothetical protein [Colocasia esculenta]